MGAFIKTFILCDSVGKDMSEKPVFGGVFSKIKALIYPSSIPFYIVTEWFVGEGSYEEKINIFTAQKDKIYFEIPSRKFTCEKEFSIKKFILPLNNFPLYRPGLLWFQALLNDKIFSEFPVIIETKISRIIGGKK